MPELSTYAVAIPVTTASGHTFLLVAKRPLVECANDMLRSAAKVLHLGSLTSAQQQPSTAPVATPA